MTHWHRVTGLQTTQGVPDLAQECAYQPNERGSWAPRKTGEPRPSRKPFQTQGEEETRDVDPGGEAGDLASLGSGKGPMPGRPLGATEPQNSYYYPTRVSLESQVRG